MCDRCIDRRAVVSGAVAASALTLAPEAVSAQEQRPAPVPTRDGKPDITPGAALDLLREGNRLFVEGRLAIPDIGEARRHELESGQAPFCTILSCSDSRVPPEYIFGRGLGELFVIRNAGNLVGDEALGSIEYAVGVLGVPLVVVMGHESCGAVQAAMEVVARNERFPGIIGDMVTPIIPAVLEVRDAPGDATENAVRSNVRRNVERLRERAHPLLQQPEAEGKLKIVGAYYGLDEGTVDFFHQP